jgi:hypothetical protein
MLLLLLLVAAATTYPRDKRCRRDHHEYMAIGMRDQLPTDSRGRSAQLRSLLLVQIKQLADTRTFCSSIHHMPLKHLLHIVVEDGHHVWDAKQASSSSFRHLHRSAVRIAGIQLSHFAYSNNASYSTRQPLQR